MDRFSWECAGPIYFVAFLIIPAALSLPQSSREDSLSYFSRSRIQSHHAALSALAYSETDKPFKDNKDDAHASFQTSNAYLMRKTRPILTRASPIWILLSYASNASPSTNSLQCPFFNLFFYTFFFLFRAADIYIRDCWAASRSTSNLKSK